MQPVQECLCRAVLFQGSVEIRRGRHVFGYSTSPLLWAIAVASCGKKNYVTCNTKLLKVCSLNGNACSGFVTRFLI